MSSGAEDNGAILASPLDSDSMHSRLHAFRTVFGVVFQASRHHPPSPDLRSGHARKVLHHATPSRLSQNCVLSSGWVYTLPATISLTGSKRLLAWFFSSVVMLDWLR